MTLTVQNGSKFDDDADNVSTGQCGSEACVLIQELRSSANELNILLVVAESISCYHGNKNDYY